MSSKDVIEKVKKYVEQLKREEKIGHALSRLERIDMSLEMLQETKVGMAVNQLRQHDIYGDDALRIVGKWKEIAKRRGIVPPKPEPEDDQYDQSSRESSSSSQNHSDYKERKRHRSRSNSPSPPPAKMKAVKEEPRDESQMKAVKLEPGTSGTSSGSKQHKVKVIKAENTMFDQLLSSANNVSSKPRKPKSTDWSDAKPEIDLNYRPLPTLTLASRPPAPPPVEEEEFNPERMFKPRNDNRIKVFAGKRKVTITEVPSLYNMCIRVVQNNIPAIEETGGIPYSILRPVLEKCTAPQLQYIEQKNPYLSEDSNELWERLVTKQCQGQDPQKRRKETWKDVFYRLEREKEERFQLLSQKISNSHKAEVDKGQRKAMLADATAPRDVRKRQIRHGTGHVTRALPSAIEVSNARRQIFQSGSKASLASIPQSVINRSSTVGAKKTSGTGGSSSKPAKKGALMVKTMKMLNMKRR